MDPVRALLIVDLQRGMAEGHPELVDLAHRVAAFVADNPDRWVLVAASRFHNRPGTTYHRIIDPNPPAREADELLPAIDALALDVVVDKVTYSSLDEELLERLRELGVTELEVVGADTDQCVLATVFAAFDAQLQPRVWSDLVLSTSGDTPHEAGLVALRRAIGEARVQEGTADSRTHGAAART